MLAPRKGPRALSVTGYRHAMFGFPFDLDGLWPGSAKPGGAKKDPPGTPVFHDPLVTEHDGIPGPINPFPMLGWIDHADSAPPMPTSLDPNNPNPKRKGGNDDVLAAQENAAHATKLLTSKDGDVSAGKNATDAMTLLLEIPADQRGRIIDGLDKKAFDALLDRVPAAEREKFGGLLAGSKNPERKLALFKEAHLSHVRNDVGRLKGDVGVDDLKTEHAFDKLTSELAPKEQKKADAQWRRQHRNELTPGGEKAIAAKRTSAQKAALADHERHVARAAHTTEELDFDVRQLEGDGKTPLALKDVDALIGRKELEYSIEKNHDLDITTEMGKSAGEPARQWKTEELERVALTLDRQPESYPLQEIHRRQGKPSVGAVYDHGTIHVNDDGVNENLSFRHGGDPRQGVDKDFTDAHGEKLSTLEFVMTHEIGHGVDRAHPEAYEKFKKAAGWEEVGKDALVADGLSQPELDDAELQRTKQDYSTGGNRRDYRGIEGKETFWAVDHSAIPDPVWDRPGVKSDPEANKWGYSHRSPDEHFAEVYAKAIHRPTELHDDLVKRPAERAIAAKQQVTAEETKLKAMPANSPDRAKLERKLTKSREFVIETERAVQQRGDEFSVMRNDVFHTDAAAKQARLRLSISVDEKQLREFDRQAAALSTPEQIATLEKSFHT
jgi:hypothetical protein